MATTLSTAVNGNGSAKTPPELAAKIQMIRALNGELDNALPPAIKKVLTPDRMTRLVVTAMRQVRNLDQCTFASLAGSLMVAAQLGLEPCTPLGHCYLIPRKNGKTGQYEATFQLGYQGMLELAYRTETIKSVTAKAVHANDEFVYEEGLDDKLVHRPYLNGDRGSVIAYYAIIKFINGGHAFDVMTFSDMMDHMQRFAPTDYKSGKVTGPWATDFDEMAKKTMIRRLFKMMRKSTDVIAKATLYDERVIDKDRETSELRPQFDEPRQPAQIPAPYQSDPVIDAEIEDEPAEQQEPETAPEPAQAVAPKTVKAAPKKKPAPAPAKAADPEPAQEAKTVPSPSSALAATVAAMESWFTDVTLQNDEGGMPDLADRETLMDWLWAKLAGSGQVKAETKHFYSRLNELAKLGGDIAGTLRILDAALESVRKDYMGEPEQEQAEEEAPQPRTTSESQTDKIAKIEKWFAEAAGEMERLGHRSLVMPSALVAAVYGLAFKAGLIKGDGQANGYRTRLIEISDIPGSAHDVIQEMKGFCKTLVAELDAPEPGSNG